MDEPRAGGYISRIEFNNGQKLQIEKNDIVILVGPNNAGKSQSLKDIYALAGDNTGSKVISGIVVTKYETQIMPLLETIATAVDGTGGRSYRVLGNSFYEHQERNFRISGSFSAFRDLFVANLNTNARLTICNPPGIINRNAGKDHPIHYASTNRDYRKWLSDNYKRAFGEELIPNTQFGATIPLCIGEPVHFDSQFADEQERQEAYAEILDTYQQVQDQGDGIKSFTGILLYLMLDYFCVYLIDEPESFLHPPQAKIMGQIIGQTLKNNQQAFIATHSEEIIKGLMETCPERIKVVRITREGDVNAFSILDNTHFNDVWTDPLLKYSNIMSSLFHKSVVLCESDSDCKMYSIVEGHIKQLEGKYSETLFIHCGGKQRMAKIATALRALNVGVKLIPDMDVLNDMAVFRGIAESFGIVWNSVASDYNILVNNLHSPIEVVNRNVAKAAILQVLEGSQNETLASNEIKSIRAAVKTISKWDSIKKNGKTGIPAGDATAAFDRLDNVLREHGIFLVPVGELENFIRDVGEHGPSWVNNVLERHPDLGDGAYDQITEFIRNMNL